MRYERRHCGSGEKTRYPDRPAAETALRHLLMGGGRVDVPLSTYACDVCRGWHLTSRPDRAPASPRGQAGGSGRTPRQERPVGANVRVVRR